MIKHLERLNAEDPQILVVDDEEDLRQLLCDLLEREGYQVSSAANGKEAMSLIAERVPDLLLLDMEMPLLSGVEVCRLLKNEPATMELPVIMITGQESEERLKDSFAEGADDFLRKPFDVRELLSRVKSHLRSKRNRDELKQTKNFLVGLIQGAGEGIVAADQEDQVVLFNRRAEEILGYRAEEALGRKARDFYHGDEDAYAVMELIRSSAYGGPDRVSSIRRSLVDRQGHLVPVNLSVSLVRDEAGEMIASVGIFTDLRDRLRTEEQLTAAQQQLQRSRQSAMVAELAGAAAHELNQPLTSVMGYSELLLRQLDEASPLYGIVENVYNEAERMATIVSKIGQITNYKTKDYVGESRILDLEDGDEPSGSSSL